MKPSQFSVQAPQHGWANLTFATRSREDAEAAFDRLAANEPCALVEYRHAGRSGVLHHILAVSLVGFTPEVAA